MMTSTPGRISRVALAALLAVAAGLAGCHTAYQLRMGELGPIDESTIAPSLAGREYHKIMMVRPSGEAGKDFDAVVALFEAEFLKHGITVISGAITGRVVLQESVRGETSGGAAQLTDIERALVMAKETGAEAIVQIGNWGWNGDSKPYRYFVAEPTTRAFREVNEAEWKGARSDMRIYFASPRVDFTGRLVDVDSGEVVAAFRCFHATNRALGADYEAKVGVMRGGGGAPMIMGENFSYAAEAGSADTKERCGRELIQVIAQHIARK